jgi:hypothetical protein
MDCRVITIHDLLLIQGKGTEVGTQKTLGKDPVGNPCEIILFKGPQIKGIDPSTRSKLLKTNPPLSSDPLEICAK